MNPRARPFPGKAQADTVTIDGAVLPTSLTYLGDSEWGSVEAYGFAYYPVIAWQPMPPAYKPGR